MILNSGGLAIDISKVKAIKMEHLKKGRNLVFELNNLLLPVYNSDTEEEELKSFPNDPVVHYFDNSDSAIAYFDEWVEMWNDYINDK
ncbi:hypothetical protein [Chryseobacterium sp. T1]